jgi:hypothetical protein
MRLTIAAVKMNSCHMILVICGPERSWWLIRVLCGEAEFEACQVAGALPVQRGAGLARLRSVPDTSPHRLPGVRLVIAVR